MPAVKAVAPPEKAILWFSLNQYWEATACKGWEDADGSIYTLSMMETYQRAGGLVRFGCPLRLLRGGEALRKEARMKSATWVMLADEGKRQGASPGDWWGTTKPMPIDGLSVEVMNTEMAWQTVRDSHPI